MIYLDYHNEWRSMMIKKGLIIFIALVIMLVPVRSYASTNDRYVTQTAKLDTVVTVKRNTKVQLIKAGKKQSQIVYNGKTYKIKTDYLHKQNSPKKHRGRKLRRAGVIRWRGCKFTWYSQRILPGRGLKIPGRHVDKQGFVCDKDDYIVIASTRSMRKKRTIVPTPFGKYGKCYDCGAGSSKWRDVYVAW